MTDLRQAAQQALDAWDNPTGMKRLCVAMDTLRSALAMHQVSDFAQAQEQQAEPSQWRDMVVVNLVREGVNKHKARELADHFSAPPQRQWVGLEAEEILDLFDRNNVYGSKWIEFARTVEAKLKERNNG